MDAKLNHQGAWDTARICLDRLLDLFFPRCCAGCDDPLVDGEHLLCVACWYRLPETNFHKDLTNEAWRLMGGQIPLDSVSCYLFFEEKSLVERIVHHFKYLGMPELGHMLGARYGHILKACAHPVTQADVLIPIPMQRNKYKKRGYNQSTQFALGLAEQFDMRIQDDLLVKKGGSHTQVGKGRLDRFENLTGKVLPALNKPSLQDQHAVLVDDVLTTGATIVSAAEALLELGVKKISVITLARKKN